MAVVMALLCTAAVCEEAGKTKRDLPAVRFDSPPVIDGDLSDPCWQKAAKAEGFTDVLYGNLVADQTVAMIGYDENAVYVAFDARDSQPNGIVARETKRGSPIRDEDFVAFSIDTFHTHEFGSRSFFVVNPLGTQYAHLAGGRHTKLEWEGAWSAAAKVASDGWRVEMAIPWKILNHPTSVGQATCGINFDRYQQRTRIHSWWSNVGPQEFYDLDGHWVGVRFPAFRPTLSLLPYAVPGWARSVGSTWKTGLDVRYSFTPSMTAVAALNPDFGTVEGAVEGIDFSYGERFVPDRRPFFQEGKDLRSINGVTNDLFYSQRIPAFDLGVNVYGSLTSRDSINVLSAWDIGRRSDTLLTAIRNFAQNGLVALAVLNHDGSTSNQVMFAATQMRKGPWRVAGIWSESWLGGHPSGNLGEAFLEYRGRRFLFLAAPHMIRPGYKNELGFVPFTDYKGVLYNACYSNEWRKGPLRGMGSWIYMNNSDHFDGRTFRRERGGGLAVQTRSDLALRVSWDGGQFEEHHDGVLGLGLKVRASDSFRNFGLDYSWGRKASARMRFLSPFVTWRWSKLTMGVKSSILRHKESAHQHIVTVNYDFSPSRGIGGRLVSQTGGTNWYLSYRQSGYGGVETFFVFGDPNAKKFTNQVLVKTVWPL